jgi:arylsulfatase
MARRNQMTTLAAVLCLLLTACDSKKEAAEAPARFINLSADLPAAAGLNVLVISFDAFRWDNIGHELGLTPNLDRFAGKSLLFENAYAAGQATASSFAAFFTGRQPFKVFRGWKLEESQTIAKVFSNGGYTTAAFLANKQLVDERHYGQGFDQYEVTYSRHDEEPLSGIKGFLDEHNAGDSDRPFFAWVHFINPHSPYLYREQSEQFYSPGYEGEYAESSGQKVQSYKPDKMQKADLDRIRELYNGEVFHADKRFQEVIDHLESRGLRDNTVIVVTADHGEAFVEHGVIGHVFLYEEVIRIPLLIHHPDMSQGKRTDARVSNIDLLPSLAAMAGLDYVPQVLDGVNWAEDFNENRPLLTTQMTNKGKLSMTLLKGDIKFISWCTESEDFREELYDLATDPGETDNLIDHDDYIDKANDMYETLELMAGQNPCGAIDDAIAGADMTDMLDPESVEALRSLGYIQ